MHTKRTTIREDGDEVVLSFFDIVGGSDRERRFYTRNGSIYEKDRGNNEHQVCYGLHRKGAPLTTKLSPVGEGQSALLAVIRRNWPIYLRDMKSFFPSA